MKKVSHKRTAFCLHIILALLLMFFVLDPCKSHSTVLQMMFSYDVNIETN